LGCFPNSCEQFRDISSYAGETGFPGDPGATGDTGGFGIQGVPGAPGFQGRPGAPGFTGPAGQPGFQGMSASHVHFSVKWYGRASLSQGWENL